MSSFSGKLVDISVLDSQCPGQNFVTISRKGIKRTENVISWKECSDRCREKPGCKYWTWYTSKSMCLTMTNARRVKKKKNVWSGTQQCGGPTVHSTPCEDKRGQPVKEGNIFIPEGDCNPRICKNGRPSDDCWAPGNNLKTTTCIDLSWTSLTLCHKRITCIDCDKKYPGCMDKDGNMYKHGEWFVPKGDCNTCSCKQGKVGGCTEMGCFK